VLEPSPQRTPVCSMPVCFPRGVNSLPTKQRPRSYPDRLRKLVRRHGAGARQAADDRVGERDLASIQGVTMVTPVSRTTHEQAVAKLAEYRQFVSTIRGLDSLRRLDRVDLAELGDDDPLATAENDANRPPLPRSTAERTWTARNGPRDRNRRQRR